MNRNLILLIVILLIGIASCTKSSSPAVVKFVTSDTSYVLENTSTVPLHVDMYLNYNDLKNQSNVFNTCLVPAKSVFKIPLSKLDSSATYYYDIYSSDYYYSNWGNAGSGQRIFDHTYEIDTFNLTQASYFFLYGGSASVTWKAVDMRDYSNSSQWSTLDANGKYVVLTLDRNISGTITTKPGGTITTANISYISYSTTGYGVLQMNLYIQSDYNYLFNSATIPSYDNYGVTSRDTLVYEDNNENYWIMARQ